MAFPATYNISYYKRDTYQFVIKPKNYDNSAFSMPSSSYSAKFYISPTRGGSLLSIVNKQLTNNVATLTTSTAHGYSVNTPVTISGVDSTFNGSYVITTVPTTTTFTYAKTNTDVSSTATTGSAINTIEASAIINSVEYSVTNKVLTSNVATLTTSTAHNYVVGDTVSVSGVDSTFNGNYVISAITPLTFSYAKTASNVSSQSVSPIGAVVSLNQASTNAVTCTITPIIGNLLGANTTYVYDISISNGTVNYTLLTGTISVTDDVTPGV